MIISLIGMSSVGKTYWAREFKNYGFKHINCDDLIEKKLEPELKKLGYKGLSDVAKWMGFPFEARYSKTSKKYMDFETEVMNEILSDVKDKVDENIIIDTTGSVIYTTGSVLRNLKSLTEVVYLEIPEYKKQEIYDDFLFNPKPIIWGKSFSPYENEDNNTALARCYADLLEFRSKKYEKLADVKIPFNMHRRKNFTPNDFIGHIKSQK